MSHETDIIGIIAENLPFQSNYIPLISFKNEEQKKAAEKYIIEEANRFFSEIFWLSAQKVRQLPYPMLITELDFKKVDISYFYENLFYDLERKPDGKLEAKDRKSVV